MDFRSLLFQQPDNIRKPIKDIKIQEKKWMQAKMAVVFNKTCLNENHLPTSTYICILNVMLLYIKM